MPEIKGLVSVVVPFYNSERFLRETVESVFAQTYTQWELLLVDDGSSDESSPIAKEYAARHPQGICYLEHPDHRNRGVNCTRNLGARNSNGEYIAFLDSDDVWLPFKLKDQVSLLNSHPDAALVYGPSEYWYDWDQDAHSAHKNHIPPVAPGRRVYAPPFLLINTYPLGRFGAPCTSSCLFRRRAFEKTGGFDEAFNPATFQVFEDLAFLSKIFLEFPVCVSETCQEKYRVNPASLWNTVKGTGHEESARRFFFRWLRSFLRSRGVTDPSVWKALRKEAWVYRLPIPDAVAILLRRIANKVSP